MGIHEIVDAHFEELIKDGHLNKEEVAEYDKDYFDTLPGF